MTKQKFINIITTIIFISLWLVYLFEAELAKYGIYTIVPYNVHEILAIVPLLSIILTIICLLVLIERKIKPVFLLIAIVFLVAQVNYLYEQSNVVSITTIAEVTSIRTGEITIKNDAGEVDLECPMLIYKLLETGKEYLIDYETNSNNTSIGEVNIIQMLD